MDMDKHLKAICIRSGTPPSTLDLVITDKVYRTSTKAANKIRYDNYIVAMKKERDWYNVMMPWFRRLSKTNNLNK